MKLLLLHLSDIHLKDHHDKNPILDRIANISTAVFSAETSPFACFVVVTGDIAFSGTSSQYDLAQTLFSSLSQLLSEKIQLKAIFPFCSWQP